MRWIPRLKKTGVARLDLLLIGAHLASMNLVSNLFEVPLGLSLFILQLGQLDLRMIRMLPSVQLLLSYIRPVHRTGRFFQLLKELINVAPLGGSFRLQLVPGYGD